MDLKEIRKNLDKIDKDIILLLAKRLSLAQNAAQSKIEKNIKRYQPEREQDILKEIAEFGKKYNLREEYTRELFKRIIKESHHTEKNIIGE